MKNYFLSTALIALVAFSTGCVASRNFREVKIIKDADGKITSTEYIERQEQRTTEMPFTYRHLNTQ